MAISIRDYRQHIRKSRITQMKTLDYIIGVILIIGGFWLMLTPNPFLPGIIGLALFLLGIFQIYVTDKSDG